MIEVIMWVVVACFIYLIFSDGIEKGLMRSEFLILFIGLPLYFMIQFNSGFGMIFGFLVGCVIACISCWIKGFCH